MSDFTKEELQHLNDGLSAWMGEVSIYPDALPALQNKIQSMIDSYPCKHEDNGMFYYTNPPKYCCKKCGEFYL